MLKIATGKESSNHTVWSKSFKIGVLTGYAFHSLEYLNSPQIKALLSSMKNAESVTERRWKVTNELLAKAVEIAKEKWKNGCPLLHDDMAKILYTKIKCPENKKKHFSVKRIGEAIKSVAPADKIRGKKGVKKNYNYKDAEDIYSRY